MDFKDKKNLLFSVIAILLTLALIFIIINSFAFLKEAIDVSLDNEDEGVSAQRFEFEKLKEIGIIKP